MGIGKPALVLAVVIAMLAVGGDRLDKGSVSRLAAGGSSKSSPFRTVACWRPRIGARPSLLPCRLAFIFAPINWPRNVLLVDRRPSRSRNGGVPVHYRNL